MPWSATGLRVPDVQVAAQGKDWNTVSSRALVATFGARPRRWTGSHKRQQSRYKPACVVPPERMAVNGVPLPVQWQRISRGVCFVRALMGEGAFRDSAVGTRNGVLDTMLNLVFTHCCLSVELAVHPGFLVVWRVVSTLQKGGLPFVERPISEPGDRSQVRVPRAQQTLNFDAAHF